MATGHTEALAGIDSLNFPCISIRSLKLCHLDFISFRPLGGCVFRNRAIAITDAIAFFVFSMLPLFFQVLVCLSAALSNNIAFFLNITDML